MAEGAYRQLVFSITNSLFPGRDLSGAEIGVNQASTSLVLLDRNPRIKLLHLVDPWKTEPGQDGFVYSHTPSDANTSFRKSLQKLEHQRHRTQWYRETCHTWAERQPHASLDFIFLDADHHYDAVSNDLQKLWPLLKPQGLLICHDYGNSSPHTAGVKSAIDDFARTVNVPVSDLGHFVAVLTKT